MNLDEIKSELRLHLSEERYRHTLGVMYTAGVMALCHGAVLSDALTAGLLHDCTKDLSEAQQRALCAREGVSLTSFEENNPKLLHSKTGAIEAGSRYGVTDEGVLNAIRFHTTGRAGMSKLEKILFVADFIEPGRKNLKILPEARQYAFTDLDECIYFISNNLCRYLQSTDEPIDNRTIETAKFYEKERSRWQK